MQLGIFAVLLPLALAVHPAIEAGLWRHDEGLSSALDSNLHRVRLALKHDSRALSTLKDTVEIVSNPDSPLYGQHLSLSELRSLIAPNPAHVDAVVEWLSAECQAVDIDLVATRDVVVAKLPISSLEKCFQVEMKAFVPHHPALAMQDRVLIRSERPHSLPKHIAPLVDLVHGVSDFPPLTKRAIRNYKKRNPTPIQQTTPGVPLITFARSRNNHLLVKFNPVCLDGTTATTLPVCGGTYHSSLFTATSTINPNAQTYSTPNQPQTTCEVQNNVVTCTLGPLAVPVYDAYNVTVSSFFNAGQFSANFPFPVLNIPPTTPNTLYKLYGMPDHPVASSGLASQCVVEFEQQYYSPSDLTQFLSEMGLPSIPVTVIGPNDASNPGGEANLDIQWMSAMSPGVPIVFWSIYANSSVEVDDILSWAYAIGNMTNPPIVNSLSYGMAEGQVDKYLGAGYVARSDLEFQKLAARGLTVIIADGDTGAGDLGPPPMGFDDCSVLHPDWPSQSPYVTAIGSTYVTPNFLPSCYPASGDIDCSAGPLGEVGVALSLGTHWTTGGGFSQITSQPSFQTNVVNNYLANSAVLPPSSVFNSSGRAYPDAVTVGHNLMTVISGVYDAVDGTSASAPIFAGMISLLNDARLQMGKSSLGWLNPLLYKLAATKPTTFFDIVIGDNKCGAVDTTPVCCAEAFRATQGWDAVSGLGSPQFNFLLEAATALP